MFKRKSKAFTLIELIATLVIMAIIALIATPLVMNIIRKARISADKRSIDAYGRSIELAIAGYLMDTGSFPTSIDELTIEYSGDEVICSTTNLNSDSSVYLAGCTVGGRSVEGYAYGKEEAGPTYTAYNVGDHVSYNGVDYYVLKDSSSNDYTVTLLKAEPLTKLEVDKLDTNISIEQTSDGYAVVEFGNNNDYRISKIKVVVDAWKNSISLSSKDIKEIRLVKYEDLITVFNYSEEVVDGKTGYENYAKTDITPDWLYNANYWYWMMDSNDLFEDRAYSVERTGDVYTNIGVTCVMGRGPCSPNGGTIRPVLELNKSADITKLNS